MAIEALVWLAQKSTRVEPFLEICGLGPHNLRRAAADPGFLAAVLNYLAADESLLIAFSQASKRAPESIGAARLCLDGGRHAGIDT